MKMKNIVVVSALLCAMLLLGACQILDNAAKLQEYDFGSDKVPTINAVVGERKVTGVETSTTNGAPQKQYTYSSTSVTSDLASYAQHLRDHGWIVTQDYNFYTIPGSAQLAKESADDGKVLVLSIAYENAKYAIKISKIEGTLEMK